MKKKTVKRIVIRMFLTCLVFVSAATAIFFYRNRQSGEKSGQDAWINDTIIQLNEIKGNSGDAAFVQDKTDVLMEDLRSKRNEGSAPDRLIFLICGLLILFLLCLFLYLYVIVLRPFDELEEYALAMAQGNFDRKLPYHRKNIFGAFTWAFDHMRVAIVRARQNEQTAIENNKTVIATLSHDIKTPIASIRGYAEALSMHMDTGAKRRERYIATILDKCDEVTKITNDMFLHAIHDLDRLEMKKEDVQLHEVIRKTVKDMAMEQEIPGMDAIAEAVLHNADANRIAQVIENIIANARKYAPGTNIAVMTRIEAVTKQKEIAALNMQCERVYHLTIRDYGAGIRDEDMPFVFDKFYRGANSGDAPGAGLGLFIVKYIMEKMQGRVTLENNNGLCVHLFFALDA